MTPYQQMVDHFRAEMQKQSSVKAEPSWVEGIRPVFPDGPMVYVDPAKPPDVRIFTWQAVQAVQAMHDRSVAQQQVQVSAVATIGEPLPGLDAINEKHEHDRIWDLLVLAAESSRYENR